MNKIHFDIRLRPEIEAGKYEVLFGDVPARIICWDKKSINGGELIVALVDDGKSEHTEYFYSDGISISAISPALYLVPPEPELTEFEVKLWEIMKAEGSPVGPREKFTNDDKRAFHEYSAQLLAIAREELFANDAVLKEYAEVSLEQGKDEALKDLPRWKKCAPCDEDKATIPAWIVRFDAELAGESAVVHNGHYILFGELEKLPKEDEK